MKEVCSLQVQDNTYETNNLLNAGRNMPSLAEREEFGVWI